MYYKNQIMSDRQIAGYIVFSHVDRPTQTKRVPFFMGENTIGRDASNRVPIPDATVSKVHAKLIVTARDMHYIDVSKNGTKLIKNNEENKIESNKAVTIFGGMTMYLGDIICVVQRIEVKNSEQTMTLIKPLEQKQQMKDKVLSSSDSQDDVMQLFNQQKKKEQTKPPQQVVEKKYDNDSFSITGDFYDQQKKGKDQKKKEKDTKKTKNAKEQKKQVVDENKKVDENVKNKKKGSQKINAQKNQKQEAPKNKEKKQEVKPIIKQTKQQKPSSTQRKTKSSLQKEQQQKIKKQKQEQKKKEKQAQQRKRKQRQSLERKEKQQQKKLKQSKEKEKQAEKFKQKKKKSKSKSKSKQKQRQPEQRLNNSRRSQRLSNTQKDQSTKRRISRKRAPRTSNNDSEFEFYQLRKSFVNKRVLVSGFAPNLTKKYFLIVDNIEDEFDYLVMKEYKRTFKALYAICKGIDILRYDWIVQSQYLQKTLKPEGYIFKQASFIYQSIHKVNIGFRVFKGFQFYLGSEEYHLKIEEIEALIYAGGGELMKKIGKLSPKEKESKNKIAIIRNFEQKTQKLYEEELKRIKKLGFDQIYTVEMILDSCERQLISWQKNKVK